MFPMPASATCGNRIPSGSEIIHGPLFDIRKDGIGKAADTETQEAPVQPLFPENGGYYGIVADSIQ